MSKGLRNKKLPVSANVFSGNFESSIPLIGGRIFAWFIVDYLLRYDYKRITIVEVRKQFVGKAPIR